MRRFIDFQDTLYEELEKEYQKNDDEIDFFLNKNIFMQLYELNLE